MDVMKRYIGIFATILLVFAFFSNTILWSAPQGLDLSGLGSESAAEPPATPVPSADPAVASAVTETTSQNTTPPQRKDSFWTILKAGGSIGFIIIILSIAAGALAIEYLVTIRLSLLVPPTAADEIFQALQAGNKAKATTLAKNQGGFLGNVVYAGLSQPGTNWDVIEKAVEDAISEHAGRIYRRVDYLSLIGNIAPMLGLLGTVVGMIVAFRNLAMSDGFSHGADLAEGIYLALITTVEGLVVAIPCLAAHSFFTNRVSNIIGDATYTIDQILRPVKQWALHRSAPEK